MSHHSVLIITEVFSPEEFLINDIAQQWIAEGKKVSVLTRNPSYPFGKVFKGYTNKLYSKKEENGMTIHRYHILENYKEDKFRRVLNYIWNSILASMIALIFLRKNKNIFIYHTGPLTVALPGVLLKKMNNGKATIWTQDLWPAVAFAYGVKSTRFNVWFIEKFVNFIYKNCDKVLTTSKPFQQDIQKRISGKIEFIPNWPMNVFWNGAVKTTSSDRRKFSFTFAGNIGEPQNLDNIIMAFHQWSEKPEDVELNIYGDGSAWKHLQSIITREGIRQVYLKGRVPVTSIPAIYQESDVLIISLRKDEVMEKYVPAKFSTYLIAGKPIFGVIAGAVKDYIVEFSLGYISDPENRNEITKGFEYFISLTPDEKLRITERANTLYEKEFEAEMNMKKLTDIVFT